MPEPAPIEEQPGPPPARRPRWQFGLRAMLALTALVAVWTAHLNNRREIARLEDRIESMAHLVPELVVDDPSRFSLVRLEDGWYDENRWELFVPEGRFLLNVATRGVGQAGLPADHRSAPMPSGRHILQVRQVESADGRGVQVLVDGSTLLQTAEPRDWYPGSGYSTSQMGGGRSEAKPADEPLILLRRRFSEAQSSGMRFEPPAPCNGVVVWIERADSPSQGPGGDRSKTPTSRDDPSSPTPSLEPTSRGPTGSTVPEGAALPEDPTRP